MCLNATKPSFVSLDSPNNIRCGDMGIEEGTGKGCSYNLDSPNIRCEAAPVPHTTQRTPAPARAYTVTILMQEATKRHVEATGHMRFDRGCAPSSRALETIWQNYPALAKHFADNITRPPFGGLHKILTSSTFLKNLAVMLEAFCEVSGST